MTLKIGKIVFKSDKNNFSPKTSDKTAKASGLECYIQVWVPFCVCWQYDVIKTLQKHVRFLLQNQLETFRLVAASWPIPIKNSFLKYLILIIYQIDLLPHLEWRLLVQW